jgi:hypothetical protein
MTNNVKNEEDRFTGVIKYFGLPESDLEKIIKIAREVAAKNGVEVEVIEEDGK